MNRNSICWNITSRCNENCQFCYRIICNKENTYEQNKKILETLIRLKVDKITWTGGESLLYPYLFDLMKEAHKNNIRNNIITNGRILTPKIIDEIEEYTDYITFSLDALEDNVNNELGRGIEHGNHIIELLDYIKNNDKDIKVKLNSIVTKKNIDNIKEVIQVARNYSLGRWKLFKFVSLRGKSIENQEEFEIRDEQYEKAVKEIKNEKLNCPIITCKEDELQERYLLINAVGDFLVTNNGKDELICDFENIDLDKIEEILKK